MSDQTTSQNASEVPPFETHKSSHADYCGLQGSGLNKTCTCSVENDPSFMGYGSDLPMTPETEAESIRERAYQDFTYDLAHKLHELYMLVDNELSKHQPMSREWQEMYIVSRQINVTVDSVRLSRDRSKHYGEVPF